MKTLWEKKKMLVITFFFIFHNVSCSITERNEYLSSSEFVVCKCFQLGQGQFFFLFGKELTLLSNNKILDQSKLKAIADNKMNVIKILKFDLGRVENFVRKGEQPFQNLSFTQSR